MLQRELRKHQWKAFIRNPTFQKNIILKVIVALGLAFLAGEFIILGLLLDRLLLQIGTGDFAIDIFNSGLLYIFLADFLIKWIFKKMNSMQIAPYLSLPIKRNKLFNFLLIKEFSSFWNLYLLFLVIPFTLRTVPPDFGFAAALLYILFFYSLCIGNSLLVNIAGYLRKINGWFLLLPLVVMAGIIGLSFVPGIRFSVFTVKLGQWILHYHPLVWLCQLFILAGLWKWNHSLMGEGLYRDLQEKKKSKTSRSFSIPFLDKFGEIGSFMNLELKMISRAKRIRQQLVALVVIPLIFFLMLYSSLFSESYNFLNLFFFAIFTMGGLGMIMCPFIFTAESSFFDGLMARKHSFVNILRSKYYLYSAYSIVMALLMLIPVLHGKLTFLFVISLLFYTIGFFYFLLFQNAVYNKNYLDLFDGGMMNWKGAAGNIHIVPFLTVLIPFVLVFLLYALFSLTVTCYFMLITGIIFTLTSNLWLKGIYKRFLKRKYVNMESFRTNA